MTTDEIIKKLRDMARYPTVTLPRDKEALMMAADLLAQPAAWVGLTDDDIWKSDEIMAANSGYGANYDTLRDLTRAIEAKLKEKNNGI